MVKNISLIKLFLLFVKIGAILFGGGYVILPILLNEFAEKRQIVAKDELVNYFAIAQSLPGIVAANVSIFIGYKLKGKIGALVALLGIIFVPFWTIVSLASILNSCADNTIIKGAMYGVGIAVIVLILLTSGEIWKNSVKDKFFYIIFLFSIISLLFFKLSPVLVIIIFSTLGILIKFFQKEVRK